MSRRETCRLSRAARSTLAMLLLVALAGAIAGAQEAEPPPGTFGFGLVESGAACCFSVRFWVPDGRGSEIVLNAYDADLFVTVRGLQRASLLEELFFYVGMGLSLRLGEVTLEDPFFMALQGLTALEGPLPLLAPLRVNVETAVELRPRQGFLVALGLGVHLYF